MDRQEAEAALTKAKERTRHARTALEDAIAHLEDCLRAEVLREAHLMIYGTEEVAGGLGVNAG